MAQRIRPWRDREDTPLIGDEAHEPGKPGTLWSRYVEMMCARWQQPAPRQDGANKDMTVWQRTLTMAAQGGAL